MNKTEFLENLKKDRKDWEATLARVTVDKMNEPVLPAGWSVKDIIAHVAWHESEMAGLLESRVLAGSEWWGLPLDERNDLIYKQNKNLPLDEVRSWAEKEYARFNTAFEPLPEEALNDPTQFKDMPPDWVPWEVVASNTYEHYREHVDDIEKWLASKGK
jgi:hypothetical protein